MTSRIFKTSFHDLYILTQFFQRPFSQIHELVPQYFSGQSLMNFTFWPVILALTFQPSISGTLNYQSIIRTLCILILHLGHLAFYLTSLGIVRINPLLRPFYMLVLHFRILHILVLHSWKGCTFDLHSRCFAPQFFSFDILRASPSLQPPLTPTHLLWISSFLPHCEIVQINCLGI